MLTWITALALFAATPFAQRAPLAHEPAATPFAQRAPLAHEPAALADERSDDSAAVGLPLDALPGRALSTAPTPQLADDHGTRAGLRLAHAAVDASGRAALLFAAPRAWELCVGRVDAHFAPAVRVPTDAPLAMGSFWGPRVALAGERVLVVGVLPSRAGRAGDVFAWLSDDAGVSFAEPVRLNALAGAAAEQIVELAAGPDGRLAVAWMHTDDDGVVSLHGVESHDFGATWRDERVLHASASGSLCPCCPPALAYARDGSALWALFRDDVDGFRDNYLLRLDDPDAVPLRLGAPHWELAGCPMSVPALRVDASGPAAVYRREGALFEARLPLRDDAVDVDTTLPDTAPHVLPEQRFDVGPASAALRWPLVASLRSDDGDSATLRLWRDGPTLRARVPGAFLDSDLGSARRVVLADSLDPDGPVLLAAELDDGKAGWRLSLRLLQAVAR